MMYSVPKQRKNPGKPPKYEDDDALTTGVRWMMYGIAFLCALIGAAIFGAIGGVIARAFL